MIENPLLEYLRRDILPTPFCSGCGCGTVLNLFAHAIHESAIKPEEIAGRSVPNSIEKVRVSSSVLERKKRPLFEKRDGNSPSVVNNLILVKNTPIPLTRVRPNPASKIHPICDCV